MVRNTIGSFLIVAALLLGGCAHNHKVLGLETRPEHPYGRKRRFQSPIIWVGWRSHGDHFWRFEWDQLLVGTKLPILAIGT
jgi:hypothetical protein